jgi:hypothetical protein
VTGRNRNCQQKISAQHIGIFQFREVFSIWARLENVRLGLSHTPNAHVLSQVKMQNHMGIDDLQIWIFIWIIDMWISKQI